MAGDTFAAASRAGHLAVADDANTVNPKLVSADGRSTWALINMPNPDIPLGTGVMDRIPQARRSAAPAGSSVSVTGFEQLQSTVDSGGGGGPSTLLETLIAAVGALVILTFMFGSPLAIVPLLGGLEQLSNVSFLVEYLVSHGAVSFPSDSRGYARLSGRGGDEEREWSPCGAL